LRSINDGGRALHIDSREHIIPGTTTYNLAILDGDGCVFHLLDRRHPASLRRSVVQFGSSHFLNGRDEQIDFQLGASGLDRHSETPDAKRLSAYSSEGRQIIYQQSKGESGLLALSLRAVTH